MVQDFNVLYGLCRLHGLCKSNPLAHLVGQLRLPLYRTSGDNSVLYDHDLERQALQIAFSDCCSVSVVDKCYFVIRFFIPVQFFMLR